MTWTLLRKELRQHWLGLLAVFTLGGMSYLLIIVASLARSRAETPFEGFRFFTAFISILGALVLNHRLVVIEYQAKTQLFLEGLPVARWRMVAVKYCLGLGVILLLVGMAFSLACLLASLHGGLTGRFAGIMVARSFSTAWCVFSFCFMLGLTGRYRFAFYVAMFLSCVILAEQKAVDFARFGPVELLDARFAYEREDFPWQALRATWAMGLAFTFVAAGLSLIREGSIAALLAEKMSHREKVLVAALLAGLVFAGSALSEKIKKAPFDLQDAAAADAPGVSVKVASGAGEHDSGAVRLAEHVARELSAMREYLGIRQLPPVFIVRRRDLDTNRYERGELPKAEGVHVRANFTAKDWQDARFLAWLIPQVLAATTHDRVKLEANRWVLDGFGEFWTSRDHPNAALADDHMLALRALYGTSQGFTLADLRSWLSFRERVGEGVAAGVAWSGLKTLSHRQGPDRCRQFLRAVLGNVAPEDLRAMLKGDSWEQYLRNQAGETPEAFFKQWQEELAALRPKLAAEVAALPRLSGQVTFLPLSATSRKLRYHVKLDPPAAEARYSFLYYSLPVFDEEVEAKALQREQNSYAQNPEAELPETYSRGQRLYWTFALDVPALGCPVISGYTRQEVP